MASNRPLSLMPTWRHTSNPSVSSPLHNMFPNQGSISAPGSLPLEDTPTRASRSQQQATRPRGESRSSSVPSGLNILPRQCSGATSPGEGLTERKSSVKHLTCFWWKEKGQCRFSDEECLYAHRDTGRYTDPPRQVIPGEPAKAGRSLDRALRSLAISTSHRSSPSLSSLPPSRPETPGLEMTRISSPSPRPFDAVSLSHLTQYNAFLRTLVENSSREKAIFAATIERLSSDNESLKGDVEALKTRGHQLQLEVQQLASERDILRSVVGQYQNQQRVPSNPFGVIGANRFSQGRPQSRYDESFSGESTDTSPVKGTFYVESE